MKNKSVRHKESNTFKFQPFSERINNLDVDIFHKVQHEYITDEDSNETFFYRTIIKWEVLNLSQSYEKFQKEISSLNYVTLPQLLLIKDNVIYILLNHIKKGDSLCLQPLLELIVALAKDLQKEFHSYFPEILEVLINLLNTKNTEQLEWVFHCLAYLFKFLWRFLIKDINSVFNSLVPLLSDNRPEYINNFAAESFAFVARKVRDKKLFINILIKAVKNQPDRIFGCGKLLFQVINGIDGEFHSCAESMLPLLFETLILQESQVQKVFFEILDNVISNILNQIQPHKSDLLWTTFTNILKKLIEHYKLSKDESDISNINLVLKVLGHVVEFKDCKFLKNSSNLNTILLETLNTCNQYEDTALIICQISILLLKSKKVKLSQEQASIIIRHLLNIPHKKVFLYFIDKIRDYIYFEVLILPIFLKFCVKHELDNDTFHLLTRIVLSKSPPCISGINLFNWTSYNLDFKEANGAIVDIISKKISQDNVEIIGNFDDFFCSLICLPHLVTKVQEDIITILEKKLEYFTELIKDECISKNKVLLIINSVLECLIHVEKNNEEFIFSTYKCIFDTLLPLTDKNEYISSLQSIDLFIAYLKQQGKYINMDLLTRIDNVINKNFNSPFHEVRLLTSHIYTAFEHLPYFDIKYTTDPDTYTESFKVFTLIYNVECINSQVDTYRDQIQNLEKLSFDKPQMMMCKETMFKCVPLRYLCGILFINFQLLWEPVIKILSTHAYGLDMNTFWDIFGGQLKNVTKEILQSKIIDVDCLEGTSWTSFGDYFQEVQIIKSKPDFGNYRILLWKALGSFAHIAEAKTRDVSELLLTYVSTEYIISNPDIVPTQSIKQNSKVDHLNNDDEISESKNNKNLSNKILVKTLVQKLRVFAQTKSPRSMYRESELYKLYFDLLQHKDLSVQKCALDCIFVYKHKYLIPYKENLYNLIDDKNFKHEVRTFRVDKESNIILPEHREGLIPIIMQIAFSKMKVKIGLRTGGKSSGQMRRSVIFKFLADCEKKEILGFLKKLLRMFDNFLKENAADTVDSVYRNCNLEKFLPPKRLLSILNMLGVIHEQCGGLLGNEALNYLLKIHLTIGAFLKFASDNIADVHSGYLSILRNLRSMCIKQVETFFDHYEHYPWSKDEINAVFTVCVWPYLAKLNVEGIHSPTSLLKLIVRWGSNPKYFPLLVKYKEDNKSFYILPHLLNLFINEKCNISVVNAIEEMLEKLLSLQPNEEDLKNPLNVDNLLEIDKEILDKVGIVDNLNYGSMILLPHVSMILAKIQNKLLTKSKSLNQKELFILSRISELVWDPNLSDTILNLLLPVVVKKCKGSLPEDVILKYCSTILNLIKNVEKPEIHLKQISPLFAIIVYPSGRKILCEILDVISKKSTDEDFKLNAMLIGELNAFDKKWVDQPDFERRHNAFKLIQEYINENKLNISLGILIIYNCSFFINNEHDLAARENSSHSLKKVALYLIQTYAKQMDLILNETLFHLIRSGLKNSKDDIRNEYISLLGHLAKECPQSHFILRDLNKYTNKSDLEVDFFENLVHLQLHRHTRALLKFCQITKDLTESPNPRTLTQFILPLASHYLCKEKFSNKNSLLDAAVECIGMVCRILPWFQYEGVLKYYLMILGTKLDYQKQLVKLIVTILDSFHYDLKNACITEQIEKHLKGTQINLKIDESNYFKKINTDSDMPSAIESTKTNVEVLKEQLEDDINEEVENTNNELNEKETEEDTVDEVTEIDDFMETDVNEEVEEEIKSDEKIKIVDKISVLCKSTATRIVNNLQIILIPKLRKSLAEMTQHESSHKLNKHKLLHEREEEDLLRIPISLALVKLLQKLPGNILDSNISWVFMKICTFLKSRLESVRKVARETLQKIMLTLGPKYLNFLLTEISPLLGRGFQAHVLVFTIHGVLNSLKDTYQPTDLDKILLTVLNLCTADLFGTLSEEKEVVKIAVKVTEARHSKSYDTLQILAQYITESCLLDLVLPIKQVLETSHSFKTVNKAQECLRYIAMGLVDNNYISLESLLKFAYGTSSKSIPQLMPKEKQKISEKEKQRREKEDCFIIPKIPGSRSLYQLQNVKNSAKTNSYILVEFGLKLCHVMLKREKFKDESYKSFIDPFILIFKNCLKSKHVKLSTLTLQCLVWVFKLDLPSLKLHIKSIIKDIFGILHKYASAGLSKGDNFDLVVAAFKVTSVLVREVDYYTINSNQLKILLLYVEQDIHNHEKQATAFNLLKSILAKKINAPELNDVMEKVAELSIISELDHVRVQSRNVFHQYIMEYPLGNALEKHLSFYLSQLSYEMRFGRESAIEMIFTMINSFPLETLKNYGGTLLVTLGARLINDEEPECRKKIAECLTAMLKKLQKSDRDPLFDIVLTWLGDKNTNHRRLAAQICGFFITIEKSSFDSRLRQLKPLLLKQFGIDNSPGRLVRLNAGEDDIKTEEQQRIKDHHLFQTLQMLLKLCTYCPTILKQVDLIEILSNHIQSLLAYPHDWVRLAAAQFLGYVLGSLDIDHLSELLINDKSDERGYLCNDPINGVKSLTLDLCDQLQPKNIKSDLAEQVIKNLVFIAKVIQKVPAGENKPNLLWLTKRMRKIINTEIVQNASCITLRTEVFKWIAGICVALELDNINSVVHHLIGPLARELSTTEEKNAPLRHLAKEVSNLLKAKIGVDEYTNILMKQQQSLSVKRAERKRSKNQLAVIDPESFAKRKIKRHEKKKEAKKRKIESLKGSKRNYKKRKVVDLENSEII